MANKRTTENNKGFEEALWNTANKLRGSVESSEYKHVVLSLIFLKFVSDRFEHRRQELIKEGQVDYVDMVDFYTMKNVFYLPEDARWSFIKKHAKQDDIALKIDSALFSIEKVNKSLKGALPDNYFSRLGIDSSKLSALIDTINNIQTAKDKEEDIVGRVYEYFLGRFAASEGKGCGEFYTPKCVVNLIAEMIEPYKGKIYDPCCGSGGMFVQSGKFVESHQGNKKEISIYGQESTSTTFKLAKMNLAIRGISANLGETAADTFFRDQHPDLKADFIMANPPFNQSEWRANDELLNDPRWSSYDIPPTSNANFGWILHIISKLSESGVAGFVMANMTLASQPGIEANIRRQLINQDLISCIVSLPDWLFYTTPIPASLWFISKNKAKQNGGIRENKVLFIDSSSMGTMLSRTSRELSDDEISKISGIYRAWKVGEENYADEPGLCKSVDLSEIISKDYTLHPAAYIEVDAPSDQASSTELQISLNTLCKANLDLSEDISITGESSRNLLRENLLDEAFLESISWEKYKINDLLVRSNERLGDRLEPEILTCTEQAGLILQRERFSKRVATENVSKYKYVRRTDIVYNPYLLWAGSIDQCWIVEHGITSPAYEVFRVRDDLDPYLVGFALTTARMIATYNGISVGTVTRRRRAAPEKFLELSCWLPRKSDQEMLSQILKNIAHLRVLGRQLERNAASLIGHSARLMLFKDNDVQDEIIENGDTEQ